jgi:hypothetical protein
MSTTIKRVRPSLFLPHTFKRRIGRLNVPQSISSIYFFLAKYVCKYNFISMKYLLAPRRGVRARRPYLRRGPAHSFYVVLFSLFFVLFFLTECSKSPNPADSPPLPFDTVFFVDSIAMPDSEVLARSIVSMGSLKRLHGFLIKAKAGNFLKIGCIGGSITAGAMASTEERRFPNRLAAFLHNLFPKSSFSVINAGIGATTSRFGCSRAHNDLLIENPDMIIIEYAVNDFLENSDLNKQTIEGLVRQCLRLDSVPTLIVAVR